VKLLVVGGGGREHAIVRAAGRSPQVAEVLCAPGNAGIAEEARCLDLATDDVDGIVRAAGAEEVGLVIVGPEGPLVEGAVDALEDAGIPAFGPSAAAARLEGSKLYAKQLMAEAGVPTASHVVLRSHEEAIAAQDYKRIGDGDEGPNTGGMGSYSPVPGFEASEVDELVDTVHRPVVEAMARRGTPFHGVLYAGLMLTADGVRVLEFNTRFGDPETQAVLPRLRSDLIDLCVAARQPGGLANARAEFGDDWAVSVVLASAGYPASSSKGDVISGLDRAAAADGVEVFHAGTAERDGEIVTNGGRVLNVTGLGPTPADARRRAYDAAELITFEGMQMRTDIAARAVERVAAG
jgi:phosphoribosylamine---glycine ligase